MLCKIVTIFTRICIDLRLYDSDAVEEGPPQPEVLLRLQNRVFRLAQLAMSVPALRQLTAEGYRVGKALGWL
jgi:hypothetical protein